MSAEEQNPYQAELSAPLADSHRRPRDRTSFRAETLRGAWLCFVYPLAVIALVALGISVYTTYSWARYDEYLQFGDIVSYHVV